MKDWSWRTMVELPADQAQQEPDASGGPGNCPCSCLRNMVRVLDAISPEEAVLESQTVLGDVTGTVVLSVYRRGAGEDMLDLVATGHSPGDTLARIRMPVTAGSMLGAVLTDGVVRWVTADEGDVSAAGVAALRDQGQTSGLLVAEFARGGTGVGKPSAVCLRCVAAVMSVVTLRARIDEARESLLLLARYRSVAELSVQVTHDFNNMMQGVLGNAALARMDVPEDTQLTGSLVAIEESATRASVLARKLLNFARDSANGGAACDAVKSASDALDLAGILYLKGVTVTKDLPGHSVRVRMTDNDLQNALILLIKSGVLRLRPITGAQLTVAGDPTSECAEIRLDLNGVAQEVSGDDGTVAGGLLSAAHAVATRTGASLDVTSVPGAISMVLTIPRDLAQSTPGSEAVPTVQVTNLKGTHVLVVGKPSPLVMLLGAAGCTAQAALTWEDAVQDAGHFAPRGVLAFIGDNSDLDAAVEGRRRLGLPVIVICQQGVGCPADKGSAVDGVLGLPLDLDDLRRILTRVLH
ncbi:MAG: nitrogen regulation protein NR(II) [Candidatus Cryosericum sp.]